MASPYIGEIRIFAGSFAPQGWAFCDGSLIQISENDALFNLIGTTYGGDGQTTFALPDLRGRLPVHQGTSTTGTTYPIGLVAGTESVTLSTQQMPAHSHPLLASNDIPALTNPAGSVTGQAAAKIYRAGSPSVQLASNMLAPAGGSQPHSNIQPFLAISFIISLFGIYPSPT